MPRDIAPSLKTEVCRPDTKKEQGTAKKKRKTKTKEFGQPIGHFG